MAKAYSYGKGARVIVSNPLTESYVPEDSTGTVVGLMRLNKFPNPTVKVRLDKNNKEAYLLEIELEPYQDPEG